MDEDELISEPEDQLPNIDEDEKSSKKDDSEPKDPHAVEAVLVVLAYGVLPDVIDFFSGGLLSTISSALLYYPTNKYFSNKGGRNPDAKKVIAAIQRLVKVFMVGDGLPIVGALPFKTIGVCMGIYMLWHPKSFITKATRTLDSDSSKFKRFKAAETMAGGAMVSEVKKRREEKQGKITEELGSVEKKDENLYDVASSGGEKLQGPEEEATSAVFEEIPKGPVPLENISRVSEPETVDGLTLKTPRQGTPQKAAPKTQQEDVGGIGGAYEEEERIKRTMTSPSEIMKNDSIRENSVEASDDGKVVDLRRFKDNRQRVAVSSQEENKNPLKKAA